MPRNKNERAVRRWCFTKNNPSAQEELDIQALGNKFIIYGREIGASGTPHLQGYVEWENAKGLGGCKLAIPGAHWEIAKGTPEQNITYCSKEDQHPYTSGIHSAQGARTDLHDLLATIKEGHSLEEIVEAHPEQFFKYHAAVDKAISLYQPKRNWPMTVKWFYGPTGTGKSHEAWNEIPDKDDIYRKMPGKWWDGYSGQSVVIFDEFRADWFKFYELLLILDKYPMLVEVKGGTRQFSSKTIIITAPIKWDEMFRGQTEEKLNQLGRRITETKLFMFRYIAPPAQDVIFHGGADIDPPGDAAYAQQLGQDFGQDYVDYIGPINDADMDDIANMFN